MSPPLSIDPEILVRWSDLHKLGRFLKEEIQEIGSEQDYIRKALSPDEKEQRIIAASEENMGLVFLTLTELLQIALRLAGVSSTNSLDESEILDLASNKILSKNIAASLQRIRRMRNKVHGHSVTPPERFWNASSEMLTILPKAIEEIALGFTKLKIELPEAGKGRSL